MVLIGEREEEACLLPETPRQNYMHNSETATENNRWIALEVFGMVLSLHNTSTHTHTLTALACTRQSSHNAEKWKR